MRHSNRWGTHSSRTVIMISFYGIVLWSQAIIYVSFRMLSRRGVVSTFTGAGKQWDARRTLPTTRHSAIHYQPCQQHNHTTRHDYWQVILYFFSEYTNHLGQCRLVRHWLKAQLQIMWILEKYGCFRSICEDDITSHYATFDKQSSASSLFTTIHAEHN